MTDQNTIDAGIALARQWVNSDCDNGNDCESCTAPGRCDFSEMKKVASVLLALHERHRPRDVLKELPEDGSLVLINVKSNTRGVEDEIIEARYTITGGGCFQVKGRSGNYNFYKDGRYGSPHPKQILFEACAGWMTHWWPLPDPPVVT